MLARCAYDCVSCFEGELRERVLRCYRSIERRKVERKKGGGGSGGGGAAGDEAGGGSSFDVAVGEWKAKEGISKRSGQGGGESWRGQSGGVLG